ncbi:hypothetical protein KKE45_02225 [Patescibacteria group bacterium]|nr:hypothetical protein [Patescibacteria group bacterium]
MSKYKYYFRKPKSEITKDIFGILLISGAVAIVATSPYFIRNVFRVYKNFKKYPRNKVCDTFYRLKKRGQINFFRSKDQIYISLTRRGKKMAGWMQIDNLKIKKPKKWDKRWRIVLFDISNLKTIYREALRGKLKELGFCIFQKSVWINPFNCEDEIKLLKEFFGLKDSEMRFIVAEKIENDSQFRKFFKLN